MIKYGTYIVYRCTAGCNHTVEIPLHLENNPPLEKYASFCTHEWVKEGELDYEQTHTEKSTDLQPSEA